MNKRTLLSATTSLLLVLTATASSAQTTSGFDTANGLDMILAVNGTQVGDWNTQQLTITGGLQTVGDGIRAGYNSNACTPAIEGTLRYNITVHAYEFCNGTSWNGFGQSDPSGEVAFFLAYSCPSGWTPSDGTNGTIDMRGEFPRGWDNGRGVDVGRGLATWEDATGIGQVVQQAAFLQFWNADTAVWYGGGQQRAGLNGYVNNQVMFTVRPRNIALLACMKV